MEENALRSLAVDVARLKASVEVTLQERLGVLEEGQGLLLDHVDQLQKAVDELTKDAQEKAVDWITIDDIDQAVAILMDLHAWVQRVYVKYRQIYACWPWHPPVVAELLAMRIAHAQAYKGRSVDKVSRWLTDRPRVAARIEIEHLVTCFPETHSHENRYYYTEIEDLAAYAQYWASCWGNPRGGQPPGLRAAPDEDGG